MSISGPFIAWSLTLKHMISVAAYDLRNEIGQSYFLKINKARKKTLNQEHNTLYLLTPSYTDLPTSYTDLPRSLCHMSCNFVSKKHVYHSNFCRYRGGKKSEHIMPIYSIFGTVERENIRSWNPQLFSWSERRILNLENFV